jgi:spore coat protein H
MYKFLALYLFSFTVFLGCGSYNNVDHSPSVSGDIQDSISWYSDMQDDVHLIRVNIPNPNDYKCAPYYDLTAPIRPCTLQDVDNDIDPNDNYEPSLHVQMQTDDFFAYSEAMNASFEQKGKSTRAADQKSYRIKLDSTLYNQERTFQLNKHAYDKSRVRNKLAFDLFKDIPNFTSLKTQFVNLEINGTDYGLFTHVEKVGKEFLINRGWNEDDNLYKAQNFDFRMLDVLKLDVDGKPLNPDAFDAVIEIERGKDHTKFVDMLNAIESANTDTGFEEVFNKYFNRNNYITWMAVNIIMANKDTQTQNFFLYNPLNSDTFYFMPRDYDGAGRATTSYAKWELGYATWWNVPLHRKFLSIKKNRDDLDEMVNFLRANYITPEIIKSRLDAYKLIITKYISRKPDSDHITYETWKDEFNILIPRLHENIANYRSQIGHPMPFWQGAFYTNGRLNLSWERSVDVDGDVVVYDLKVSNNPDFNTTIINESGLSDTPTIDADNIYYSKDINLSAGTYYMKVVSRELNDPTHYQIGFEKNVEVNGTKYFGVFQFEVQ